MNSVSTSPASVAPASPPASGGKSPEATADRPFSQVLSSEMAEKSRPVDAVRERKSEARDGRAAETTAVADDAQDDAISASDAAHRDPTRIAAAFDLLRAEALPAVPAADIALATPSTGSAPAGDDADASDIAPAKRFNPGIGQERSTGRHAKAGSSSSATQPADDARASSGAAIAAQADKTKPERFGAALMGVQSDVRKPGDALGDLANSSALRALAQAPEAPTPLSGASATRLAPSVGTTAWGQALGEKVLWMAAGAQQTASLTLNPPELGPMKIVLNVSNEQATASFFSAQPEVRQALEAAFPRLREMMNEAGIQLGQATVSADTPQQQGFESPTARARGAFNAPGEGLGGDTAALPQAVRVGRGLVDTFA